MAAMPRPLRLLLSLEDWAQTARRCYRFERGPPPVGPDGGRVAVAKTGNLGHLCQLADGFGRQPKRCSAPRCCRLGRGPSPVVPDEGRVVVEQAEGSIEQPGLARASLQKPHKRWWPGKPKKTRTSHHTVPACQGHV